MPGTGPFLWISKTKAPYGYWEVPEGGFCASVLLFVTRAARTEGSSAPSRARGEHGGGEDGKLLVGEYADDPRWETLAGHAASVR
ncbi:MAG: hypothetical protein ACYDCK_14345 [Thermoplasmatota archaeon]